MNDSNGMARLAIVEGLLAVLRAIEEVIENDEVTGMGVLLQATTSVRSQHVRATRLL